jgi:HSP20 family molecular chaperone IbpA
MEILDQMAQDARTLYEQLTGKTYARTEVPQSRVPLPQNTDPVGYVYQELALLKNLLAAHRGNVGTFSLAWMPIIDAFETNEGRLVIRVEVPGCAKSQIVLSVGERLLVVKGERTFETPDKRVTVLAKERFYGPFERWIPLPYAVKAGEVETMFENGVLEIRLLKAPQRSTLEQVNLG